MQQPAEESLTSVPSENILFEALHLWLIDLFGAVFVSFCQNVNSLIAWAIHSNSNWKRKCIGPFLDQTSVVDFAIGLR